MEPNRFTPEAHASLPCLSWCARVRNGEPAILLLHGEAVEAEESWFCEGAWSSDFDKHDFGSALFFSGSGGYVTPEGIEFATATHTLGQLFLMRLGDETLVSNSLAFLLSQAGDDLDRKYKFYAHDMMSVMDGIRKYVQAIPTRDGNRVEQFYFCNVSIERNGRVTRKEKPLPPSPRNYGEYAQFLDEQVRAVAANARDPARKHQYEPITTISSGYDSTTASAFAKSVGCRQAITFTMSRGHGVDSGREVAERLGLEVVEFDREEYRKHDGSEVEFLATGNGGEDMVMAPLAELFTGKLVFTGFYGLIWDRINPDAGPDLLKSDASGCSMEEFRLRVGFIHFPVPYIGCRRHPDIYRISGSDELKPWRSGDDSYDKPIPRRFLEELGVPGKLFGQKKRGATQPFITVCRDDPPPEEVLTTKSLREFSEFTKGIAFFNGPFERGYLFLMRQLSRLNRFVLRAWRQAGFCERAGLLVSMKYRKKISEAHLIFPWAVSKVMDRYRLPNQKYRSASEAVETADAKFTGLKPGVNEMESAPSTSMAVVAQ
jgi:hypothetical protein